MQRYLIWWLLFQFSSVSCTLLTTPLHPNKGEPSLIFIKNSCSLWKFQGKRAHIYWMWACIAPFNQSRPSPNLGEIISWFAVEETGSQRWCYLHKVPHPECGEAEIQTLAPTLPPQTTSSMELERCEVWWGPLSYAHRDPANSLGLPGHETGADVLRWH